MGAGGQVAPAQFGGISMVANLHASLVDVFILWMPHSDT